MIPAEAVTAVRSQIDEPDAANWSDDEIRNHLWFGERLVIDKIGCYTGTSATTSTVSGTQEYSKPSDSFRVSKVTYDSVKLKKIDQADYDAMSSISYGGTLATGSPCYYYEFGSVIGLFPVPDAAKTLKFWYVKEPANLTSSSDVFSVPSFAQNAIVDYATYRALLKDNDKKADMYFSLWENGLRDAIESYSKMQEDDMHIRFKIEEQTNFTDLGTI